MAVTSTYTSAGYGTGTVTGSTPGGTGGVLVALLFYGNPGANTPIPVTASDWTLIDSHADWASSRISRYITDVATPDLGFTYTDNELGVMLYRVDDAASPLVYGSAWDDFVIAFTTGTVTLPDVTVATGDGVALLHYNIDGSTALPSSQSLSWTLDRSGDIGPAGWYAHDMASYSLIGASASGSFDAGTATWTATGAASAGTIFVHTAAAAARPPEPSWSYRSSILRR